MGSALARALVEKGFKTTVWNRTAAKAEPIVALGGHLAGTPDECIQASELSIFCLLDQRAVHETLVNLASDAGEARILVDYTSGLPSDHYRSQQLATSKSFSAYLRGAIESMPQYIGLPASILYYSGNDVAYRKIEAALAVFGTSHYLGGDVSLASLQESVLGTCFYTFGVGFIQTMALLKNSKLYAPGGAEKFTAECLIPLVTEQLTATFLDMAREIDADDYAPKGTGVMVSTLASSLGGLIRTHSEQGVSATLLQAMLTMIETRVGQGHGADEMASIIDVFKQSP